MDQKASFTFQRLYPSGLREQIFVPGHNLQSTWRRRCSDVCGVRGSDPYLAVQLLVQLADALSQLGQLLCDDSMVDRLSGVRLHVKVLRHKITVALWGGGNKKHTHKT